MASYSQLDRTYTLRVVEDSDRSRKYKCTMWQDEDDVIRGQQQPPVIRPWRDDEIFGELDSSTEPLPPDVFVLLLRYNCSHVLHASPLEVAAEGEPSLVGGGYREAKECCCWIKKSGIIGDNGDELLYTVNRLREIIRSFDSYFSYRDVHGMVTEIMACALAIGEENWNNGREGVSCIYDISAIHDIYEDVEYIITPIISESPASRHAIESLPRAEIKVSGNEKSCSVAASSCAVCWDEILTGNEVIWMPCSHFYHGRCITEWLLRKNTCPLCRFPLNPETEIDEGTEEN